MRARVLQPHRITLGVSAAEPPTLKQSSALPLRARRRNTIGAAPPQGDEKKSALPHLRPALGVTEARLDAALFDDRQNVVLCSSQRRRSSMSGRGAAAADAASLALLHARLLILEDCLRAAASSYDLRVSSSSGPAVDSLMVGRVIQKMSALLTSTMDSVWDRLSVSDNHSNSEGIVSDATASHKPQRGSLPHSAENCAPLRSVSASSSTSSSSAVYGPDGDAVGLGSGAAVVSHPRGVSIVSTSGRSDNEYSAPDNHADLSSAGFSSTVRCDESRQSLHSSSADGDASAREAAGGSDLSTRSATHCLQVMVAAVGRDVPRLEISGPAAAAPVHDFGNAFDTVSAAATTLTHCSSHGPAVSSLVLGMGSTTTNDSISLPSTSTTRITAAAHAEQPLPQQEPDHRTADDERSASSSSSRSAHSRIPDSPLGSPDDDFLIGQTARGAFLMEGISIVRIAHADPAAAAVAGVAASADNASPAPPLHPCVTVPEDHGNEVVPPVRSAVSSVPRLGLGFGQAFGGQSQQHPVFGHKSVLSRQSSGSSDGDSDLIDGISSSCSCGGDDVPTGSSGSSGPGSGSATASSAHDSGDDDDVCAAGALSHGDPRLLLFSDTVPPVARRVSIPMLLVGGGAASGSSTLTGPSNSGSMGSGHGSEVGRSPTHAPHAPISSFQEEFDSHSDEWSLSWREHANVQNQRVNRGKG